MIARIAVALLSLSPFALWGCTQEADPPSRGSFELGAAIQGQCEPAGGGIPAAFCQPLAAAISELRAETRDDAWAAGMEQRIDEMFRSDGKYWAEIRSLDCRQTLCAVEYAQDVNGGPTLNEMAFVRLLQWLEPTTGGMGYEVSPASSQYKVVVVMVWKKKSLTRNG